MIYHELRLLQYQEVEKIFRHYLNIWGNNIPLIFAQKAWYVLGQNGLTNYDNDIKEMEVRSYALAICMLYHEYCWLTSWEGMGNVNFWGNKVSFEILSDFGLPQDKIEDILDKVILVLSNSYGERYLNRELWINCQEAARGGLMFAGEADMVIRVLEKKNDPNYEAGYSFLMSGRFSELNKYESITLYNFFDRIDE